MQALEEQVCSTSYDNVIPEMSHTQILLAIKVARARPETGRTGK